MENLSEKEWQIIHLVQLISRMKGAVEWHKGQSAVSRSSIRNFTEIKSRLEKELLGLLVTELDIRLPAAA